MSYWSCALFHDHPNSGFYRILQYFGNASA